MQYKNIIKEKYYKKFYEKEKLFFIFFLKIFILFSIFLSKKLFKLLNIESNTNKNAITIKSSSKYKIFNKMKSKLTDPFLIAFMKEISIIRHIFTDKTEIFKKKKNKIYITLSINNDENYKYIVFVSMLSLLLNCNKTKTFIIYHILCSPDFKKSSIRIFLPLLRKFSQNVEMVFYNMGYLFMNRNTNNYPPATFYRVFTPLFID